MKASTARRPEALRPITEGPITELERAEETRQGKGRGGVARVGANLNRFAVLALICSAACAGSREPLAAAPAMGPSTPTTPLPNAASSVEASAILGDPSDIEWASHTGSPRWDTEPPVRLAGCEAIERPLAHVAAAVAAARASGSPRFDMRDVVSLLRATGSPHVWPRVWMLEAEALDEAELAAEWSRWISREPHVGQRRCGVARVHADSDRSVVVALVVDALADLAPVPLRARVGQWISLDAPLLAAAGAGQLVLLGPDDVLRSVPSRLDVGAFHSVFTLGSAGFWRLQVLLDVGSGPQPALEGWVFADVEPDLEVALRAAPGEVPEPSAAAGPSELRAALWAMVDAGRRSRGLPSLRRETRLDELAQAHGRAMLRTGRTAHDVGDGMPIQRVTAAGITTRRVGENVARARSLERAHRVLWDSPSHRGNLLDPGYDAIGIGVERAGTDDVLVCELFVDYGGTMDGGRPGTPAARASASRSSSGIWSEPGAAPYGTEPTVGQGREP